MRSRRFPTTSQSRQNMIRTTIPIRLLLLVAVGFAAGAVLAQSKEQAEANARLAVSECDSSLGFRPNQPLTENQRADLKSCVITLVARQRLQQGSKDTIDKFFGSYIPNCEEILGTEWGDVGSEKRNKLVACIRMQAERDLDWENKIDQTLFIQGLQKWVNKRTPIDCYTYGNWTQCR